MTEWKATMKSDPHTNKRLCYGSEKSVARQQDKQGLAEQVYIKGKEREERKGEGGGVRRSKPKKETSENELTTISKEASQINMVGRAVNGREVPLSDQRKSSHIANGPATSMSPTFQEPCQNGVHSQESNLDGERGLENIFTGGWLEEFHKFTLKIGDGR